MGTSLRPLSNPRHLNNDMDGNGPTDGNAHEVRIANDIWPRQVGSDQMDSMVLSPGSRHRNLPLFGNQLDQNQGRLTPFDNAGHRNQQSLPVNAALLAHQQEQRGVSQLQNAVSAATGEQVTRSPLVEATTPLSVAVNGAGLASQQGGPPGLEKRGPVEFNHAISYVNKIKVSVDNSNFTG